MWEFKAIGDVFGFQWNATKLKNEKFWHCIRFHVIQAIRYLDDVIISYPVVSGLPNGSGELAFDVETDGGANVA